MRNRQYFEDADGHLQAIANAGARDASDDAMLTVPLDDNQQQVYVSLRDNGCSDSTIYHFLYTGRPAVAPPRARAADTADRRVSLLVGIGKEIRSLIAAAENMSEGDLSLLLARLREIERQVRFDRSTTGGRMT